jgi:transcriptional regulator with XRE-family HTH domain
MRKARVPSRRQSLPPEPPAPVQIPVNAGKSLVRPDYREFARRLREAMVARQLSASDVARAIWGTVPDPRGYQVAKNRDRIGAYLAGTGYPSKETLPKLCEAVGLSIEELPVPMRSTAARSTASSPADLSFSLLQDHPGLCSIYVRTVMSIELGLKSVALVQQDRSNEASPGDHVLPPKLAHTLEEMVDALVQKRMEKVREDRETILADTPH